VCSFHSRIELLVAALACGGCSFTFVAPPPAVVHRPEPHPHAGCTSSRLAPIADALLTGYEAFRVGYAAQASEQDYEGLPVDRKTDLWLGVGFGAVFLGSAIYGTIATSRCQRLKEGPDPDEPTPGRSASLARP
jgi:hypothetical protein